MFNLKALALAALATVSTVAAPASASTPHVELFKTLVQAGLDVRVNEARDCDPNHNGGFKAFGWYHGPTQSLVICQEQILRGYGTWNGQAVNFTEEDLDTLRHEAHHFVQDCRDGAINQQLHAVYQKPIDLAVNWLGADGARKVVEMYSDSSQHIQVMELEAFAVAAMNDPAEQVRDIQRFCF